MTFGDRVRGIAIALFTGCLLAVTPAAGAPSAPGGPGTAPLAQAPNGPQHLDAVMGQEAVLNPMPILTKTGTASWAEGFDALVAALKDITAEMDRLGLKRAGDAMVAYTASDEAGFDYEAQIPFSGATTEKPANGVGLGASYSGRVLKFGHVGSFADMDNTYEAIANYLDARNIEAQDLYIERYLTDPVTAPPESLEVEIFVPLR
ncbi:GyrI-like domain-containing protein [Aquabacter spiritensis]|nr:GyrI-like domain-containing protein [Aquabacter spiritensis]